MIAAATSFIPLFRRLDPLQQVEPATKESAQQDDSRSHEKHQTPAPTRRR